MVLEDSCDSLCMLDALFRNDGKVANGDPIIGHKVVQRVFVVVDNFIRRESRHNGKVCGWSQKVAIQGMGLIRKAFARKWSN